MGRVDGKAALVTGAAQGLGAAAAERLALEGASVLLTDVDTVNLEQTAARIAERSQSKVRWLGQDVTEEADWHRALDLARDEFGGLNILVNNAGIGALGSVEDETLKNWRRVHAIDLDSVFIGCKLAIPLMAGSGGGSIVNISSISGIIAGHNLAAYNSAKAAVRHLSKSVALHCARSRNGIRCNSVHPSFVDTPILDGLAGSAGRDAAIAKLERQIPLGRIGRPEEVGYAVLYLASDESGFTTGTELIGDGGISAM